MKNTLNVLTKRDSNIKGFFAYAILLILIISELFLIKIFDLFIQKNQISSKIKKHPRVYFLCLPYFYPLYVYQINLIQNCDNIEDADYLVLYNQYWRNGGYVDLKWNESYINMIFSKKIIAVSEEDILVNRPSFNFRFLNKINAIVGINTEQSLAHFFKIPKVFSHLIFARYVENHNASYESFINRPFYIQTAISNRNLMINSNRVKYLKELMKFFGKEKVANYGHLFRNQKLEGNYYFTQLPPNSYFGFAMENSIADFRITEKVFLMYRNDAIPIYRGSIKNREIMKTYGINTDAFVDASNLSVKELVNLIDELIKDKKKMYDIYKQPLIPNKTFFDNKIKSFFDKVFDTI